MPDFTEGEIVDKYLFERKLGNGNFGQVWLAHDHALDRKVALKIIQNSVFDFQLLDEAKNGYAVKHSNLLEIFEANVRQVNNEYLVMIAQKYHKKGSIINLYNPYKFIPIKDAIKYLIQILKGLDHLHTNSVLHNDIKPSNILIDDHNNAVLCDYGLSAKFEVENGAECYKGYIPHLAPESFRKNQRTIQTDIYQVGLTAFRIINGHDALEEDLQKVTDMDSLEQLKAKAKFPSQNKYLPFVPPNVKQIINKAIHPDPTQRFASALDMRRSLEKLQLYGQWTVDENGNWIGELKVGLTHARL